MKLKMIIGSIIFLLTVTIGILINKNLINEKKIEEKQIELQSYYPKIYDSIDSITINSFEKSIKNKEKLLVYVGRPTCSDCNLFEPLFINQINKNDWNSYITYLNVAKIKKNEHKWLEFKKQYHLNYTPTIAFYKNGKLVDKLEWSPNKVILNSELNKFIEKYKNDIL